MIRLQGISKSYPGRPQPALHQIDLHVPPGQFTFLTGASGAGKTTLLRLLYGDEAPSQGRLKVCGQELGRLPRRRLPALRRCMGVIFQDFRLLPGLSVFDNVAVTLLACGQSGADAGQAVERALALVDLAAQADHPVRGLSGGEQQRVAVARALVHQPALILADEPTGNLDPANAKRVLAVLWDRHKQGAAVVVATHDPGLMALVPGARVIRLTGGRLEKTS